jgi:hypothetical protein
MYWNAELEDLWKQVGDLCQLLRAVRANERWRMGLGDESLVKKEVCAHGNGMLGSGMAVD